MSRGGDTTLVTTPTPSATGLSTGRDEGGRRDRRGWNNRGGDSRGGGEQCRDRRDRCSRDKSRGGDTKYGTRTPRGGRLSGQLSLESSGTSFRFQVTAAENNGLRPGSTQRLLELLNIRVHFIMPIGRFGPGPELRLFQ